MFFKILDVNRDCGDIIKVKLDGGGIISTYYFEKSGDVVLYSHSYTVGSTNGKMLLSEAIPELQEVYAQVK